VERTHIARFDARFAALDAGASSTSPEEMARCALAARGTRFPVRRTARRRFFDFAEQGLRRRSDADVQFENNRVSSSAIRAALAAGDFALAQRLLGHPYTLSGRVAHGAKLGRELGFPTANIVLRHPSPLPAFTWSTRASAGRAWRASASGRR